MAVLTCAHCQLEFEDTFPHTELKLIVKGETKVTVHFASIECLWEWVCLINRDSEAMVKVGLKRNGDEVLQ